MFFYKWIHGGRKMTNTRCFIAVFMLFDIKDFQNEVVNNRI